MHRGPKVHEGQWRTSQSSGQLHPGCDTIAHSCANYHGIEADDDDEGAQAPGAAAHIVRANADPNDEAVSLRAICTHSRANTGGNGRRGCNSPHKGAPRKAATASWA